MEITEVKVFPIQEEKLRAFVSIVIDRCFMVNDIKVIQGRDGLFISMPSRRKKNGDFKDIAHPLNNETRRMIEERILTEYEGVVGEPVQRRVHRAESEAAMAGNGELPQRRGGDAAARRAADARRGAGAASQRLVLDRSLGGPPARGHGILPPRARCRHAESGMGWPTGGEGGRFLNSMGRGQVVRHETLDLAIGGSNPPAPARALNARGSGGAGHSMPQGRVESGPPNARLTGGRSSTPGCECPGGRAGPGIRNHSTPEEWSCTGR